MSAMLSFYIERPEFFSVKRLGRKISRLHNEGWTFADIREILELPRGFVRKIRKATR